MSLTTVAVLPESELKDGQMFVPEAASIISSSHSFIRKEVAFGSEGKILLSRLGDKVYATSAFCTHYGAPLAKGVLAADGRVVWYGYSTAVV